ncbi:MAG: DUF6585 family protein [Synechococcales bacterium]|nr:DUF6585 family protein [Synechococcales bacterium]
MDSIGLALRSRKKQTVLYEQGFLVMQGEDAQIVRFEQVEAVYIKKLDVSYEGTSALTMLGGTLLGGVVGGALSSLASGRILLRYKINMRDGRVISSDFPEVGGRALEELTLREMPVLKDSYREGKDLQFGALLISKKGLESKKGILPWSELEAPTVDEQFRLVIKRQRSWLAWLQLLIEKIPNFPICFDLLTELQKTQGNL